MHIFQLHNDGFIQEELEDEENLAASSNWLLPSAEFQGLWENLIYDISVKTDVNIFIFLLLVHLFVHAAHKTWNLLRERERESIRREHGNRSTFLECRFCILCQKRNFKIFIMPQVHKKCHPVRTFSCGRFPNWWRQWLAPKEISRRTLNIGSQSWRLIG